MDFSYGIDYQLSQSTLVYTDRFSTGDGRCMRSHINFNNFLLTRLKYPQIDLYKLQITVYNSKIYE